MEWLTGWSGWLIAGFVLLILEVFIPGVFLMWWGLAGIVVAGLVALTAISTSWQFIVFAILALIFSFLWWRYQSQQDKKANDDSNLNQLDHAMLGKQGVVAEVLANGTLRGKFGDTTWKVQGENLNVGDRIEVVAVQGINLDVKKVS